MTEIALPSGAKLRPLVEADVPPLLEILRQPSVREWWGPFDEARLRKHFDDVTSSWTLEIDGEVAGLFTVNEESDPDYRNFELDLFVAEPHQGRGLGPEALGALLRHFFEEHDHHHAVIWCSPRNERAIKVYEGLGFKRVGIMRQCQLEPDGSWSDELILDLLAGELQAA